MAGEAREPLTPTDAATGGGFLAKNGKLIALVLAGVVVVAAIVGGIVAVVMSSHHHDQDQQSFDKVTSLPGFNDPSAWGFDAYSGMLDVDGPVAGYDGLKIHYQFHTSRRDPAKDPVVIWHQGGPGGSSILFGLYNELGAFIIGDPVHGDYINPWSWNKVANMLYIESPAGSGGSYGYSQCLKGGAPTNCMWTDQTQAEAYANTLLAFFDVFPEYASNDFYLSGESYFGQYGPNIAHYILNNEPFNSRINLKGILAGNACWGGTENCVACNGPSSDKLTADFFYKKNLFSRKLKTQIDNTCNFSSSYGPGTSHTSPFDCDISVSPGLSDDCNDLLDEMYAQAGPMNIYNVYDNCPLTNDFLKRVGKDTLWLLRTLRQGLHDPARTHSYLTELNGGYPWDCNGDVNDWITSPDVKKALHLDGIENGTSTFDYTCSGPASIVLWPELVTKLRVLIYNGDADACVPYNGNEEWIDGLESQGVINQTSPWTPWYAREGNWTAAGYVTKYMSPGSVSLTFATVRLAGHMVPTYQPQAGFTMFERFLEGDLS